MPNSLPGQIAAAMGMCSAKDGEKFGRERRRPLDVPLVLVGGAVPNKGFGELLPAMVKGLKDAGARSVAVVDKEPAEVAALIERYASAV